jgi:hypothetical protein
MAAHYLANHGMYTPAQVDADINRCEAEWKALTPRERTALLKRRRSLSSTAPPPKPPATSNLRRSADDAGPPTARKRKLSSSVDSASDAVQACSYCSATFMRTHNLAHHLLLVHPDEDDVQALVAAMTPCKKH